ncbi:MAG: hypothetical protein ACKVUT_18320 [Gaiella sp.]
MNPYILEMAYPNLELWGFFHEAAVGSSFSVSMVGPREGYDSGRFLSMVLDPLKGLKSQGWDSTIVTRGQGDSGAVEVIASGELVPFASLGATAAMVS